MNDDIADDVDFEPSDEMGETGAAQAKIKKLRIELKEAQSKRDEYLAGWQRAKADAINDKRDAMQTAKRVAQRATETFVEDMLPALDSFDMATASASWEAVSEEWRTGMNYVQSQLLVALERNGVKRFGSVGDKFDPARYEAVQEVDDGTGESHTVLKVLRHGYMAEDRIIRPAQVIVRA